MTATAAAAAADTPSSSSSQSDTEGSVSYIHSSTRSRQVLPPVTDKSESDAHHATTITSTTYLCWSEIFSQTIPGYLQVLFRSKKPFSRLYCKQFLHQKADAIRYSKITGVQNLKTNCLNIILKCCIS